MSVADHLSSSIPTRRIKNVQFGLFSPEEVRANSVVAVEHAETFDFATGLPKPGGLLDMRLGTNDRNFKCATCGEGMTECPGHFGHIDLVRPVFHVGFMSKIKKVLETVCFYCGHIRVDDEAIRTTPPKSFRDSRSRLNHCWSLAKGKTICDVGLKSGDDDGGSTGGVGGWSSKQQGRIGCGHRQPVIRREGLKLNITFKKTAATAALSEDGHGGGANDDTAPTKSYLSPEKVLSIFKRISDEECVSLGFDPLFSRPEWMLIHCLPVPPPPVRPSIQMDLGGMRSEDDLTFKLSDIIKANSNLRKHEMDGSPPHILTEYEQLLQFHIATYMDNSLPGMPQALQKSGRPLKSLKARLKGKEGRIRGNLMGKRVDFSSRTVITPDPNLSLDEVGVPRSIAKTLTIPERVTVWNISKLQAYVDNGPSEHPGARYIIRDDGQRIDLRYAAAAGPRSGSSMVLQPGYVVERHLIDGDTVLFNRQPSLHKMSMMAHRVRVMPWSTFRLNLSVTTPYNADFDGDEMNLHAPQSLETKAELNELCMVPKMIVSPQSNKPVMGIVQDTLSGIRKFTRRNVFIGYGELQNLLLWVSDWDGKVPQPAILKPLPLWTGKQLMSLIIPKGINMSSYHSAHPDDERGEMSPGDTRVLIESGTLVAGILCKKTVGNTSGGLIHLIWLEKGAEVARVFFNNCQTVVNGWLLGHGFSIGIGDTIADHSTMQTINNTIAEAKDAVKSIILKAQEARLECAPGMSVRESFESEVNKVLNKARDASGTSAQRSLKEQNNVKQMVVSGSKGTFINISQMTACVGQQNVEGKRIPFGFRDRTLPHFTKDDFGPESRGFAENSYLRGLTPQEFFFHAMGGREGLIDTAVKTAETGYIQRRLVKALEDVMVRYDSTVRNAGGEIVQFRYGEDGIDGTNIELQPMDFLRLSDEDFERRYKVDVTLVDHELMQRFSKLLIPAIWVEMTSDPAHQLALDLEYQTLEEDRQRLRFFIFQDGLGQRALPLNLKRLIWDAQRMFQIDPRRPSDLSPALCLKKVSLLLSSKLPVVIGEDSISKEAQENAILLFSIHLKATLAYRRLVEEFHLSTMAFDWLLGEVESRFMKGIVAPGEMVGTIAAQSIGEPATQMTLNTFHLAGVSSNLTAGVPRLKEIINLAKNIKTPSLTIHLSSALASSTLEGAKQVQVEMEETCLSRITASTSIHYDPVKEGTLVEEDRDFVEAFYELPDEGHDASLLSPWLLRIILDRGRMLDKQLTMAEIVLKIQEDFGSDLHVLASDDNAETLVLRIRIVNSTGSTNGSSSMATTKDNMDDDSGNAMQQSFSTTGNHLEEDVFLRKIEENILNTVRLRGIDGIKRVFLMEHKSEKIVKASGDWKNTTEWVLATEGCNLRDAMNHPSSDSTKVFSNSILEVCSVLGIEAARATILRELRKVIESYINYRHLGMLIDVMTSKGYLLAITRHGINRADTSALMRCSFEETVEILLEAASNGEMDPCNGVAENLVLGQLAPLGTGSIQMRVDELALAHVLEEEMGLLSFSKESLMDDGHDIGGGTSGGYGHAAPYSPISGGFSPVWSGVGTTSNAGKWSPVAGASDLWRPGMAASPGYSPASPGYSPASPGYSPASPGYSPASPGYSPASPGYSPASPGYSPASPGYSPASPGYSPASPGYSPASPGYSPASPGYSPASPAYSPTSPAYSPASPAYSPTSPAYSPASPAYSPTSPAYSPTSPAYSPASPAYSPSSPAAYAPTLSTTTTTTSSAAADSSKKDKSK